MSACAEECQFPLEEAKPGYDIVVLKRGEGPQPGPEVLEAPGHCGLYSAHTAESVFLLGGNQRDRVCVAPYQADSVLGVRRIGASSQTAEEA